MSAIPAAALQADAPARHDDAGGSFSLGDLLALQADTRPQRPFLTDGMRGNRLNFSQAHARVSSLGAFLETLGLERNAIVAVLAPSSAEAVVALLACLNAGLRPLLLPPSANFSQLSSMIVKTPPDAVITVAGPGAGSLPDIAVRLAAAHESVRFVMGFGAPLPNGVIGLDQALHDAPALLLPVAAAEILLGQTNGAPARLALDPLIAAATDYAAETAIDSEDRLVLTVGLNTLHGLACGLGAALMTGAQLTLLDAPDSLTLTQALMGADRVRLIWPGRLEDMLADMPPHLLRGVTLAHSAPWERQTHRTLPLAAPFPIIDAWNFGGRALAFVARRDGAGPAHAPMVQDSHAPPHGAALTLSVDADGRLRAAGPAVQSDDAARWLDLGIMLFRDHHGGIVAYETIAAHRKNPA